MSPAKFRQWELILDLVSHLLDPKTLAISSCVSRRWSSTLSSPHIWAPLLLSHYPSLSPLPSPDPRRLFSLLQTSSSSLLRRRTRRRPLFSLSDIALALDVFYADGGGHVFSALRRGYELINQEAGVFRFDVGVENGAAAAAAVDVVKEMRVVWNVVMEGWRGAVAVMDTVGKGRVVGGGEYEIWFSEELPGNVGCSVVGDGGFSGGGVVAELGFGLGERRRVERVRFGLMSSVKEWRYLSVDDALLYMQPFLLQSNV